MVSPLLRCDVAAAQECVRRETAAVMGTAWGSVPFGPRAGSEAEGTGVRD